MKVRKQILESEREEFYGNDGDDSNDSLPGSPMFVEQKTNNLDIAINPPVKVPAEETTLNEEVIQPAVELQLMDPPPPTTTIESIAPPTATSNDGESSLPIASTVEKQDDFVRDDLLSFEGGEPALAT
jgi:hypothetical protein